MLQRTLLRFFICLTVLTVNTKAQARFYWDGGPVFPTMAPWELLLLGIIILALAAALIFILVKLIYFFFAPK